jgi:hypothetical protein
VRSNSKGNLKGLLIFPDNPSNFEREERYSQIHLKSLKKLSKSPPKKKTEIFPVERPPQDSETEKRIPFTARMPGENLNSLQFISSDNIEGPK